MAQHELEFTKIFTYKRDHTWKLPPADAFFTGDTKQKETLKQQKSSLNHLKSSLNGFDIKEWNRHTNYVNPAGKILQMVRKRIEPELPTQAWCKFYEVLSYCDVISPQPSMTICAIHLCEAPGGFVCSLNQYLKSRFEFTKTRYLWLANALNPYHEGNTLDKCILDDRLICGTLKSWYFGKDNTGNIMQDGFIKDLGSFFRHAISPEPINLVTADGSFNCQHDPAEQETIVAHLKYTEMFTALHLLGNGGTFVVKMFTLFEHHSVSFIYFLCCVFSSVTITKPSTSKAGNSEVYVVARDYVGIETCEKYLDSMRRFYPFQSVMKNGVTMIPQSLIPENFLDQHIQCTGCFSAHQKAAINRNLFYYRHRSKMHTSDIKQLQHIFTQQYFDLCEMKKLHHKSFVVKSPVAKSHFKQTPKLEGSFSHRVLQLNNLEAHNSLVSLHESISTLEFVCAPSTLVWTKDFITTGTLPDEIHSSLYCNTDLIVSYTSAYNSLPSLLLYPELCTTIPVINNNLITEHVQQTVNICTTSVMDLRPFQESQIQPYNRWFCKLVMDCDKTLSFSQLQSMLDPDEEDEFEFPGIMFCNLVSCLPKPDIWPELLLRETIISSLLVIFRLLKYNGSCFVILPTMLTRLTSHVIWLFSYSFEKVFLQPITTKGCEAPPAILFGGHGYKVPKSYGSLISVLQNICSQEIASKHIQVLELLPVTQLMLSEGKNSNQPECKFAAAIRDANETCLEELTTVMCNANK